MALKGLATQAELATFQDALDTLSENVRFHVNETPPAGTPFGSTISLAHGIDLIEGWVDADGNDLRVYTDSAGDLVSDAYVSGKANFVRFIVGGQPYYAPVQTTTDPGQPFGTGALSSTADLAAAPGNSALVTEYITTETQTALNVNSLFLEHTRLSAEQAHVPLSVSTANTLDSAGHLVATHLLQLQWRSIVYVIPVSNRLGGPIQTPRGGNYAYALLSSSGYSGIPAPVPPTTCPSALSGTGPFTYELQYWDGSNWLDADPTYPANTLVHIPPGIKNGHGTIPISWSDATGCITVFDMNSGANATSETWFRMRIVGGGGTVYSNTVTVKMTEQDPGSCFFFKTALDWRIPDFLVYDLKDEFYSDRCRRGYKWMAHWGVPLMDRSRLFFNLVRYGLIAPVVKWSAFRYRRLNSWGWLLGIYCRSWLLLWRAIGCVAKEPPRHPPGWVEKHLTVLDTKPKA